MKNYVDRCIDLCKTRNPGEEEFHQAVEKVLNSLKPVIEKHPEYEEAAILERITEPDRGITFKVVWTDDKGNIRINKGYRYQFNNAIGPYKGGIRFTPYVYPGIIKFLGFEQIFKNSLTGLPIGGGKGGADFEPHGKSDAEIMRFCQAFMTELYKYIGPSIDVPAGDVGVGAREIGYLFGQYKKLTGNFEGVLTGKGQEFGGAKMRPESTGFGIVWFLEEMLKANGDSIEGKEVAISGYGNVAWGTAMKLTELGAKCITLSGTDGYIYDKNGINTEEKWNYMLELRRCNHDGIKPYADKFDGVEFYPNKKPWSHKADIYIPCATQNEITLDDAKDIVNNCAKYLCEGANMPTTSEAQDYLQENGVIIAPSKAANAGGVAVSCLEMGQNAAKLTFSEDQILEQLHSIMVNIHKNCAQASMEYYGEYDLIKGANIAGFIKVADAMLAQGVL